MVVEARPGEFDGVRAALAREFQDLALWVAPACSATTAGAFRVTGDGLEAALESWWAKTTDESRAAIDRLRLDRSTLIHILRGKVEQLRARGAASYLATDSAAQRQCLFHPVSKGIGDYRNWDVIYDLLDRADGVPQAVAADLALMSERQATARQAALMPDSGAHRRSWPASRARTDQQVTT